MENKKEIQWINCAKFIAIMAVIVDHTNGVLYTNYNIALASYFSVSLFILIAGLLSFKSKEKHKNSWFITFVKSSKNIIIAYCIATFVYEIYIYRFFDVSSYIQHILHFNGSGPFYYVFLYVQLMLVSSLLYRILKWIPEKFNLLWELGIGIIILILSALTTNYTNIFDIYGGGGKLFGGTYLFLFFVGMLMQKHDFFGQITLKKSVLFSVVGLIAWFVWWRFECYNKFELDGSLPFGNGFNPPSITSIVMSIIILFLSYGLFTLLEYSKLLSKSVTLV